MKINGSEWNINVFLLIAAYVENEKKNLRRELAQNFLWRVEKVKVFSFWIKKFKTKIWRNIWNATKYDVYELEDFISLNMIHKFAYQTFYGRKDILPIKC